MDVNVAGTRTVLDAAAASDRVRRMVFVSSAGVYGDGSPEETHLQDLLTMRQLLEAVHGGGFLLGSTRATPCGRSPSAATPRSGARSRPGWCSARSASRCTPRRRSRPVVVLPPERSGHRASSTPQVEVIVLVLRRPSCHGWLVSGHADLCFLGHGRTRGSRAPRATTRPRTRGDDVRGAQPRR
ncbi:NAD-dependent epimerase/dehydratase family protein [Streptomyces sp. NPDC059566]|uniref:NAD-dependent epimerase/dehydratase family protein n=1 Tax=Streptomyces sp. NPDC059566 TaxID=3346866 RepID=UPI0036737CD8